MGLCQGFQFPDITGSVGFFIRWNARQSESGGLYATNDLEKFPSGATENCINSNIKMSAGKSNGVYGNSSTIQPKTFYVLMIVKV